MADQNINRLARRLVTLENRHDALARARQLPASSVVRPGGESVGIDEAVDQAVDASAGLASLDEQVVDLDHISDSGAWNSSIAPEWIPGVSDGFDAGVLAHGRAQAAGAVANDAAEAAKSARETADGKNRVFVQVDKPSIDENLHPAQGDLWYRLDDEERIAEVLVWDGSEWAPYQIVADSLLVPGSIGNVLIKDGAIDAMTIRGAQIYGGYIEAPVIASSSALGTGANVLIDPEFRTDPGEQWVASGHLGDTAEHVQVDTITWDGTWTDRVYETGYPQGRNRPRRNWGLIRGVARVIPQLGQRAGKMIYPNFSWFSTEPRSFNNPYSYPNFDRPNSAAGGKYDPAFKAVPDGPLPLAGIARTTYVTNKTAFPVVVGELWNASFIYRRLRQEELEFVESFSIEVVNAATGAVLWSRPSDEAEMLAGSVNDWWESTFTGNVQVRFKAVYTAGDGTMYRSTSDGDYANTSADGVLQPDSESYDSSVQFNWASTPWRSGSTRATSPKYLQVRAGVTLWVANASFSKIQPEKGWRLSRENGFEFYNALGSVTGRLDGEYNFLNGRFATAETGARAEMVFSTHRVTDAAGNITGYLTGGEKSRLMAHQATITDLILTGDTDWVYPTLLAGVNMAGNPFGYRRKNGVVWLRGRVSMPALQPIFYMPLGFRIDGSEDNVLAVDTGQYSRLNIRADGAIQRQDSGNVYTSLGGISYLALEV